MNAQANDRPAIEFDEANHRYFVNGQQMPSVSEILRPLTDFSRIPPDVLEFARERGTAVHRACELWDLGTLDTDSIDRIVSTYLLAWIMFRKDTGFVPGLIEHRVYSETFGYCGTLDRAGVMKKLDGSPHAIIDIKTPVQLGEAVGLQLAAYEGAMRDNMPTTPAPCLRYVVQLRGDGQYRLVPYRDKDDFALFVGLMTMPADFPRLDGETGKHWIARWVQLKTSRAVASSHFWRQNF